MTPHHHLLQPPFLYFNNPDATENRAHGFYTPQPSTVPMGDYFLASSRPQSAGPQPFAVPSMETPKPRQQRPQLMLQTQDTPYVMRLDTSSYMPPTPTLSAGSSISSGSFSSRCLDSPAIATPADVEYFPNPFDGFKVNEDDVFGDVMHNGYDAQSPPCSPGMLCST